MFATTQCISGKAAVLLIASLLLAGCASEQALLNQTQPLQERMDRVEQNLASSNEASLRAAEVRADALERRQLKLENRLVEVLTGLAKLHDQFEARELRAAEALSRLGVEDAQLDNRLDGLEQQLQAATEIARKAAEQGHGMLARQERGISEDVRLQAAITDAEGRIDELARVARSAEGALSGRLAALHQRQAEVERASAGAAGAVNTRLRLAEEKLNTLSGLVQEALALAAKELFLANGKEAFTVTLTDDKVLYPQNDPYLEPSDTAKLAELTARLVKLDQEYHLDIQGHTTNNSTEDNNYSLGKARAEVVKRHLHEKQGISINRMSTISYGANKPLAAGNGNNRRIFIRVLVLK
jgi:peptidoglycan-associated lipoprotein